MVEINHHGNAVYKPLHDPIRVSNIGVIRIEPGNKFLWCILRHRRRNPRNDVLFIITTDWKWCSGSGVGFTALRACVTEYALDISRIGVWTITSATGSHAKPIVSDPFSGVYDDFISLAWAPSIWLVKRQRTWVLV